MRKSDNERHRSSLAVWLSAVALLLPLMYVLSVGPAAWLYEHGGLSPPLRELVSLPFAPLGWLRDHNGTFARMIDWYIDLWR